MILSKPNIKSKINLAGEQFGFLTAIESVGKHKDTRCNMWRCICICGNETTVISASLRSGKTKSCGCLLKTAHTKHGKYYHPLYSIFRSMRTRCNNAKAKDYKYYGGRGIAIHKEWLDNFSVFYDWAIENGWKQGLEIDRIDTNGNYCPDNCRIVDVITNANNRRNNSLIEHNGVTKSVSQWSRESGVAISTIRVRLSKKMSTDKVLSKSDFRFL